MVRPLISLLPDLGRRWQPLGLTDEGWRSLYCTIEIFINIPTLIAQLL